MTKQEAEDFFARNPELLVMIRGMLDDGLLEKLDIVHPYGRVKTKEDALVNCVEAFRALGESC